MLADWLPFWIAMLTAFAVGLWANLPVLAILGLWCLLLVVAWQFVPK